MRALVQVKESELTRYFKEMMENLRHAETAARMLGTSAYAYNGQVIFEQVMEVDEKNLVFSIEMNLDNEREMRAKVMEKARELEKLISEYEKVLVKKMVLALDKSQSQNGE